MDQRAPAPSSVLYQQYPEDIRRIYRDAIEARDRHHTKHELLLELAEVSLTNFASLAFSDYRSASHDPSQEVEQLLEVTRTDPLTFGRTLNLFRASSTATSDPLFPVEGPLRRDGLPAATRLAAVNSEIRRGIEGLSPGTPSTALALEVFVEKGMKSSGKRISWWKGWDELVSYRNCIAHSAANRWPRHHDRYYELLTPLLEAAVVEILTYPPAAKAVLSHPLGTVTLVTPEPNGNTVHRVYGEVGGIFLETTVSAPAPLTELWSDDDWQASDASTVVLKLGDGEGDDPSFRALYWDISQSPPPRMSTRSPGAVDRIRSVIPSRARRDRPLEGRGQAPGTCGEFIQGVLPDGTPFHVTCPINKSSTVDVELRPAEQLEINGVLEEKSKLTLALRFTLEALDMESNAVQVRHWSDLDIAKGMGSSTADVLAGIRAVSDAAGRELSMEEQGALAARVESSDGTMYPGIAVVNHKTGERLRAWAWFPEFTIVMLVPKDSVNTEAVSFDEQDEAADDYARILGKMEEVIAERSLEAFARLSTEAAALNTSYLVNRYALALANRLDEFGALGLNIGHTGSVCGLLYPNTPEGQLRASEAAFAVRQQFPDLGDVKVVTTPRCSERR